MRNEKYPISVNQYSFNERHVTQNAGQHMYDIQMSERNIVIEKSKHLGLIGVFVQQNYSQTNAPRV